MQLHRRGRAPLATLGLSLFTTFALGVSALAEPAALEEAGQTNLFLDRDNAQVHVLVRPQQRLILAFPAENSGHGLWFDGQLEVQPGSLEALPDPQGGQRVQLRLTVAQPTTVRTVLLDSLRVLRDQGEGDGTLAGKVEAARHSAEDEGAYLRIGRREQWVVYRRPQAGLTSPSPDFELGLSPAKLGQDGKVTLSPGEVTVQARLPFAPMGRFQTEELYSPAYLSSQGQKSERVTRSLRALEFLTRREKMMAGSWRFLTYFGRDTLISTAMLEPILSDQALQASITSVLERLSPEGAVAHEEDIGPFAQWRNLSESKTSSLNPVYDHKMIDDDLLLPLLLAKLEERGHGELLSRLLSDPKTRDPILRNADYARGMLSRPEPIRLLPGEATGDWRDSHEGLGDGVYPCSVNGDLALPTVRALQRLEARLQAPRTEVQASLEKLVPLWQQRSEEYWVELSPEEVQARLQAFSATLTPARRAGFEKLLSEHSEFQERSVRFPALSFNDDKTPVKVMHSDVAFSLFYGNPDAAKLESILTLLERPFPYGLKSPAGYLVANPILSDNPKHWQSLGFGQYHGLVVWSWPQAMLSLGLMRQHGRFPALDQRISRLAQEIRQSEERVGTLATSELWAVDLNESGLTWRAYGVAGDQTESNALQLWSTVYPALEFVRQNSAIWR